MSVPVTPQHEESRDKSPAVSHIQSKVDLQSGIKIKCAGKVAELFPLKLKKIGKNLSKCVKYNGKWMTPVEFENISGSHARKWRQSIKCDGKELGDWLVEHGLEPRDSSQKQCGSKPSQTIQDTCSQHCDNPCNETPGDTSEHPDTFHHTKTVVQQHPDRVLDTEHGQETCLIHNSEDEASQSGLQATIVHADAYPSPQSMPVVIDFNHMAQDLEQRLTSSIKSIVSQAIDSLKIQVEAKIHILFKQVEALNLRVKELEKAQGSGCRSFSSPSQSSPNSVSQNIPSEHISVCDRQSVTESVAEKTIRLLQSQVRSLSSQQQKLVDEKEMEKRRCNLIVGNMEESIAEAPNKTTEKVTTLFREKLKLDLMPKFVRRIGKAQGGKQRLILVRMENPTEKIEVMRSARFLRGSALFIMDDLSKKERDNRRVLVSAMKQARHEGKRAFIRYSDGKLIVNGEIQPVSHSSTSPPIPVSNTLST